MNEQDQTVLYAVAGSVATITLNRPDKRNALNETLIAGVKASLREADNNKEVRSIVIRGSGSDFCSGADLSALQKISGASVLENAEDARSLMELFVLPREVSVPVVAAVRGRALAGGCGLATACDIVLAASSARFGYPEVNIGFVPAMVMAILRRNTSERLAFELLVRGTEVDAEEARSLGLVNRVFGDETFDDEVSDYLRGFEKMSKSAIALTKALFYQIDSMDFSTALATGADVNVIARMTEDCRQGIEKFLERSKRNS
jgi:methylglutaconyl-CoA hydratase